VSDHQGALLGAYRILIPYFSLPGGPCLAFLDVLQFGDDDAIAFREIRDHEDGIIASGVLSCAWQGQQVNCETGVRHMHPREIESSAIVAIDFRSRRAGAVSVNRGVLTLSDPGRQAALTVATRAEELRVTFVQNHHDSAYAWLNCKMAGLEPPTDFPVKWMGRRSRRENAWEWSAYDYPVVWVHSDMLESRERLPSRCTWRGKMATLTWPRRSGHIVMQP